MIRIIKGIVAVSTAALFLAAFSSCSDKEESTEATYVYGQIESLNGNEVTLSLATVNDSAVESESDSDSGDDSASDGQNQGGPGGNRGDMSLPDGASMPDRGDMSDMSFPDGASMPDGSSGAESGSGSFPQGGGQMQGGQDSTESSYTFTGEEQTITIPVGVDVTTELGTDKFKRKSCCKPYKMICSSFVFM